MGNIEPPKKVNYGPILPMLPLAETLWDRNAVVGRKKGKLEVKSHRW